jgi:hypothetical protein
MPDAAMPDAGVPLDAFVVPDAAMDPDAYVPPGVDASFPDAAAPDAASGEDAGQPVDAAGADGGAADVGSRDAGAVGAARARIPFTCTCRASSRGGAPLALLASSSIATLLWQRRRRVRR